MNDDDRRVQLLHHIKDFIFDAYYQMPNESGKHLLIFDLRDDFGRSAMRLISNYAIPTEAKDEAVKASYSDEPLVQSVAANDWTFRKIIDPNDERNFSFPSNQFGVLLFAYGGMLLSWFPIPLISDGQHCRRV